MNNKIIVLCAFAICYGCRINKEKSERIHTDNHSQGSLETSTSWTQFNSWDSSYRYWHYTGDSTFFFHPDLGLWSHSGQLIYGEKLAVQRQETAITHNYDSLGVENNRTASLIKVKTDRKRLSGWLWLWSVIPVLAVYWLCRRR
jgi:hypothetical protein